MALVRALRFAHVAVDAFVGDHQRHLAVPLLLKFSVFEPLVHTRLHELAHIAAEDGDLAHHGRGDEHVLLAGVRNTVSTSG
jgi:hypothetical protein